MVTELLDNFAVAIGRGATRSAFGQAAPEAISKVGVGVGVAVTVIVEAVMAGYDIRKASKKWKDTELIESREEFMEGVTDIVLLALFRSGGSISGMVVGQIVIPFLLLAASWELFLESSVGILLENAYQQKAPKLLLI